MQPHIAKSNGNATRAIRTVLALMFYASTIPTTTNTVNTLDRIVNGISATSSIPQYGSKVGWVARDSGHIHASKTSADHTRPDIVLITAE